MGVVGERCLVGVEELRWAEVVVRIPCQEEGIAE